MAQVPKIIDLRRSYLPMDPNAFPPTMHGTTGEDNPEDRIPVIPYDGYNFMPTPQGYCSYFGDNSSLGINALTANVDFIFVLQKQTLENFAVALTETGIWTKDLSSSGAWTQAITLSAPGSGLHKNWSFCVIDDVFYCYRQAEAAFWKWGAGVSYVFTAVTPTFLTMAGQLGIFKAGGRLGFWDSEDSFSWSALEDTGDFTASLTTLAGNIKFQDLVGKTVNVLSHGEGFIIYATKSIVHVKRETGSQFLWKGKAIFNNNGISYRQEVCAGDPDTTHFVFTINGLYIITNGEPSLSSPEAATYLREKKEPIYLQLLNGRYLFLQFLNSYYLQGRINFNAEAVGGTAYTFGEATEAVEGLDVDSQQSIYNVAKTLDENFRSFFLNDTLGYDTNAEASTPAEVPIYEAKLVTVVPLTELNAYVAYAPTTNGSPAYFGGKTVNTTKAFNAGSGPNVNAIVQSTTRLHDGVVRVSAGSAITTTIDPVAEGFWEKQNFLWDLEVKYLNDWLTYLTTTFNTSFTAQTVTDTNRKLFVGTSSGALAAGTGLSFQWNILGSEDASNNNFDVGAPNLNAITNKTYGVNSTSQWIQRSIQKLFRLYSEVATEATDPQAPLECVWRSYSAQAVTSNTANNALASVASGIITSVTETTYANAIANFVASFTAQLTSAGVTSISGSLHEEVASNQTTAYFVKGRALVFLFNGTTGSGAGQIYVVVRPYRPADGYFSQLLVFDTRDVQNNLYDKLSYFKEVLTVGNPVYAAAAKMKLNFGNITQGDITPNFTVGQYKEVGYTQVTGHGHYTDENTFVVDDGTDEPATHDDYYTPSAPAETTDVYWNTFPLAIDPWDNGNFAGFVNPISINGTDYENLGEGSSGGYTVTIPSGTILLQEGSIEPIYPTFLGAFVFDTHYKKWGKMKYSYKNLVDMYPVNTMAGQGIFPYESFMPKMGARISDGSFPIFDQFPEDSKIVFGKVGFYRKGFSKIEEIHYQHRYPSTGALQLEGSIDGKSISPAITISRPYTNVAVKAEGFGYSARWFDIIFTGHYDLVALEPRMQRTSRR